jgi:hypothetical protein
MWKEREKNTNRRGTLARLKEKKGASSTHLWLQNLHLLVRLDSTMVAANSVSALPTNYSDTCDFLNKTSST